MRIAYVNTIFRQNHSGGGQAHIGQFIKNTLELGHEVWVYPGNDYPGPKVIPTDHLNHIKTLRQMDVLYIRLENRIPVFCEWAVFPKRNLYGFPLVVWEFNTLPDEIDQIISVSHKKNIILERSSRGCDLAVCVSPYLSEIVTRKLKIKRVITIPNGSDPGLFTPHAPLAPRMAAFQDKFNVVWIGTIKESWHDLGMLGEAANRLWQDEKGRNITFHIIGAGLSGFMAEMPPNVFYWGGEKYELLPEWLSGMRVGLSLYKPGKSYYNSPLKFFDYLSSGLVVISTEHPFVGGILTTLQASDLIIPNGDAQALAVVLKKLSLDQERVKQLGVQGRQLIIEKYNWHQAVSDTMSAVHGSLKEKGVDLKE